MNEWQPVDADTPKGRKLLGGYWNEAGNWRTITMRYYLPGTLDSSEWNESEDGYAEEGWYEEYEAASEQIFPTECPPTHWMPLPAPPSKGSQP